MKPKRILIAAAVAATLVGAALVARGVSAPAAPQARPAKPALTVTAETPRREQLPMGLAANGSVAAWQEASVGAEASGLRLATVNVNVGDVVRRGQVLAAFAPDTTQA